MKFAVVEYDSKSHDIWRHTKAKPNYLADPKTEIDATSFGCYVSALAGEHIPLTKLAKSNRVWRRGVKRLTGSWPSFSIDYLKQFDVLMFVHQLSDAHEVVNVMQQLKQLSPKTFIIGVPTQPYGLLKPQVEGNENIKNNLVNFINACDVFISVVQETAGWYEDLAKVPVKYLPQPYPASFASKNFLTRDKKDKTILVAGVTQRDNIGQGQIIAKALQKKFPDYKILLPKVEALDYDYKNLADANYAVLPFELWREHLKTLAKTTLVINTDYTKTRGRVQVDCAAVGTPSLGGNSDGMRDLFPELKSTPETKIEELVALGKKLITDINFYSHTANYALDRLKKYDYNDSRARLELLVKSNS